MRAIVAVAAVVLAGCATRQNGSAAACAPVSGALASGVSLAPMAGRFVFTMVAQDGRNVAGYLTLRAAPANLPGPAAGARTSHIGTTDILLETVGARRLGDTGSESPQAPGIAVYEQRPATGAPTVTARIGSRITAPPTPGMTQIEGEYTTLFVRRVSGDGFSGGWTSGDGSPGAETRGRFCAVRVSE